MYGTQILNALKTYTDIPFAHYAWSKAPEFVSGGSPYYGVLTENKIEKITFGDKTKEEVLDCDIDVFCYSDVFDSAKFQVEAVLDTYNIAYELTDTMYEQDTALVHILWHCRCIYCDGSSPQSILYLHDLQQHITAGYDKVQVQDANIVAGNIKKNVSILGVVGTYDASILPEYTGGYTKQSHTRQTQTFATADTSFLQDLVIEQNPEEYYENDYGGLSYSIL